MIVNAKRRKKKPFPTGILRAHAAGGPAAQCLRVVRRPGARSRGWVLLDGRAIPVALGPAGIRHAKREGDGATPAGIWHALELRWRPDRGRRPATPLPARPMRPDDGWCDAPGEACYNRPVRRPFRASHEEMWRQDGLYDLVVVLDHNQRPRTARGGSAVFLHIARPGFAPTAGCIAFRPADLRRVLARLGPGTRIEVG